MEFWVIWFIGIAIAIVTRIVIYKVMGKAINEAGIYDNNKAVRIITNLLAIICIVSVGGILIGEWLAIFTGDNGIFSTNIIDKVVILIGLVCMTIAMGFILYCLLFATLGLYYFGRFLQGVFIVTFIASIIGWCIAISVYNAHIETTTKTVVESYEERELLYFCNIPVQQVSGEFEGSLGLGSVSGEIITSDNLTYWYFNDGEETSDSASAEESNIVFVDNNQSPYVEIVEYAIQKTSKNHNNGAEKTTTEKQWKEYNFYLPKAIKQNLEE